MARYTGLARGLGLFGLGLGLAEVLVPRRVAAIAGIDRTTGNGLLRAVGLRELAAVPGLMLTRRPSLWTWVRAGGDAMDLVLLGRALSQRGVRRDRATAATLAVAGVAALDVAASLLLSREKDRDAGSGPRGARPVRAAVTIARSRDEVYEFWRDLENLPTFMRHLEEVTVTGTGRSHWQANGPASSSVSWEAEIVAEEPPRLIAWRSVEGSTVTNSGMVRFEQAPGDRGTEVRLEMTYEPPAGGLGAAVARLFGEEPRQQVSEDLRRLKQVLETGETIESEATTGGRRRRQRPAQPLDALVPVA